MSFTFGILTISDSCSSGENIDHSGPFLVNLVKQFYPSSTIRVIGCIPDDYNEIKSTLICWCDALTCNVILTTGGTGFAPRDVTPEATRAILDKLAPAIMNHIISKGMEVTPMAVLSRAVCGIRNQTFILNLPGSKKGAAESFGFVADILKHAIEVMLDRKEEVIRAHNAIQVQGDGNEVLSKVRIGCAALRNRTSPYPMVPVAEAISIISSVIVTIPDTACVLINVEDSLGRVLGSAVFSNTPLPPFPASTKDGYAVIAADGTGVRKVVDAIAAGDSPTRFRLNPGEITRISTGAPVPDGADAVVQVEDTELVTTSADKMNELEVKINVAASVGLDIRPVGSDIPAKCEILNEGEEITSAHIGLMAAMGITRIVVKKRLSIAIISSGNELQELGLPLETGKIYDSNKLTLINLLKKYGYNGDDYGIARDDPNDIKRKLTAAFKKHDVILTTGGISMGEYDLIKEVLSNDFGAKIHFGRVDMKPGKPTTFATCYYDNKQKLVFALPGNPVSATVTCLVFVLPALLKFEHRTKADTSLTTVVLDMDIELDSRPEYMRVKLTNSQGQLLALTTGNQISSRLGSLVGADALLVLPGRTKEVPIMEKGSTVKAILLN